jgi:WD repeat-containing protein 23
MLIASAWNGYGMSTGTCTVHSWNDGAEDDEAEPKMGLRVDQKLDVDPEYYRSPEQTSFGRTRAERRNMGFARGVLPDE